MYNQLITKAAALATIPQLKDRDGYGFIPAVNLFLDRYLPII